MAIPSSADTPQAVAQYLAAKAAAARPRREIEKRAFGMADLSGLAGKATDWVKNNPPVAGAALGIGGGALLGGLTSLGQREEERDTPGNMLTGALAGGGLGLGAGLLLPRLSQVASGQPDAPPPRAEEINQALHERGQQHAQNAPTIMGSVARMAPVEAPVLAFGAHRLATRLPNGPKDLRQFAASGEANVPEGLRAQLDKLPDNAHVSKMIDGSKNKAYGDPFQDNGGPRKWDWRRPVASLRKPFEPAARTRPTSFEGVSAGELPNFLRQGYKARMEGVRETYPIKGKGILGYLAALAGPALADYAYRSMQHGAASPD